MQVRDRRTGQVVELPDDTDDDGIIQHFAGQQPTPNLAQSFMGSAQQFAGPIAQQLAQGPQRSTLPNIGGGAMVGLTPQQAQFTLQTAQQSNVDSMANKMRQQQLTQQSLESEKDRAQTLKLRQQDLKNQIAERKILAEQAKFEAEMKVQEEALREKGVTERHLATLRKPINVSEGGAIVDPTTGEETYKNPKTFAPPRAAAPRAPRTQIVSEMVRDPDTGEIYENQVLMNMDTGEVVRDIGPAVPKGGGSGSDGGMSQEQQMRAYGNIRESIDKQQELLDPGDEGYLTPEQRDEQADATFQRRMKLFSSRQQSGTPAPRPREELDAEVADWINKGYMSYVENGEVVVVTPDGKAPK